MPLKTLNRERDYNQIKELLDIFPVTAILGPRQVGKTTLAKLFRPNHLFDLENPRDLVIMDNPTAHVRRFARIDHD